MANEQPTKGRWGSVAPRSLILVGIGIIGLIWPVFSMYQSSNQPKPPLQVSGEVLGIAVEDSAGTTPSIWTTLAVNPPVEASTSELTFQFSLGTTTEPSTVSVSIFLQGRFADAYTACDQGQSTSVAFNEFSDIEKDLTYGLLRDASGDTSTPQLVLAEQASAMSFTRISFAQDFAPSDANSSSRYMTIKCVMDSGALWNKMSDALWDIATPAVGMIAAGQPPVDSTAPRTTLTSTLSVSRGEQLFYQEGYPAPSTRDQASDSFTESATSRTYADSHVLVFADPINSRYSDTVAESQGGNTVFFAGVLAGLFASFIGSGLLGIIDELLRFRASVELDEGQLQSLQPSPRTERTSFLRRRPWRRDST